MKSISLTKVLLLAFAAISSAIAHADIEYNVKPNPASKSFAIRMTITNPQKTETVRIPAWCPGFYFILDYDKQLYDFHPYDSDGNQLKVQKVDSRGYKIDDPDQKPITISYRIRGNDAGLGFFRSHLRANLGFINGASAFMFAEGHLKDPCRATFDLPEGWDLATAMTTDGKGTYSADGYDEFIDNPIQMGLFIRKHFTVNNIPYEVIWVADPTPKCDIDAETERLKRGSLPALRMFGGASFKKYIYFVHLEVGDFAGGLEHRACNVIAVANTETIHLDALATHEYFHAWNVKQIRPWILGPFDYTKEQRSPNIWFSEGVTDYYAQLHAYQAGFLSRSQLLDEYANQIEDVQNSRTRTQLTLEEVCRKTWEGGGFGYGDLSYYNKGLIVGLLSDAYIRGTTQGKHSLDDLMRSFYAKYKLPNPGFQDDAIKQGVIELTSDKYGPIYDGMVRSTLALPYDLVKMLGLRLTVPDQTYTDPLYLVDDNDRVTNATPSNLDEGLRDGDLVEYAKLTEQRNVEVHVDRDGKKLTFILPGRTYRASDYRLRPNPFATPEEKQRLKEWLTIPN